MDKHHQFSNAALPAFLLDVVNFIGELEVKNCQKFINLDLEPKNLDAEADTTNDD